MKMRLAMNLNFRYDIEFKCICRNCGAEFYNHIKNERECYLYSHLDTVTQLHKCSDGEEHEGVYGVGDVQAYKVKISKEEEDNDGGDEQEGD